MLSAITQWFTVRLRGARSRWGRLLQQVEHFERGFRQCSDEQLRQASLSLRYRAKSGEPLWRLMPEAYGLVREAARRTLNMRHYDVQVLGGIALARGCIAEMETGEGKTLTATLPLYLYALLGKGAHLATVNDYLAQRDAEWMGPIYRLLGMTVGVVQSPTPPEARRAAYRCDITYGTAKEFGFDFLRDRLVLRAMQRQRMWGDEAPLSSLLVGREAFFALVDEADSVLIDEATTPLIIGTADRRVQERVAACFRWAARVCQQFEQDRHYDYDHEKRKVELTDAGRQLVRSLSQSALVAREPLEQLYRYVERAIKVQREFFRDQHYVVRNGEIVIVDEYTGRLGEGRRWREGIHQAIEAKEGVPITMPTGHAARITVQDYFLRYPHLSGMTGTAISAAREFRKVYRLPVICIPTNKPVRREQLPTRVYATAREKWEAIVAEVQAMNDVGRPVLIGTRTIEKSELLSQMLSQVGIEHQVLNARHLAAEAKIVAQAGQRGRVTVATNMAGRGTDIVLGEGVAELGGLHVIGTEIHDARRIDRQLYGRCGRQGDPGTYRQYLSLEDEILERGFGPKRAARIARRWCDVDVPLHQLTRLFRAAQRRVEKRNLRQRMILLFHEKERQKMHREMGQDPYLDSTD